MTQIVCDVCKKTDVVFLNDKIKLPFVTNGWKSFDVCTSCLGKLQSWLDGKGDLK